MKQASIETPLTIAIIAFQLFVQWATKLVDDSRYYFINDIMSGRF